MKMLRSSLIRSLLLLAIVPAITWGLAMLADRIAARRGESGVTRALRVPARLRHSSRAA